MPVWMVEIEVPNGWRTSGFVTDEEALEGAEKLFERKGSRVRITKLVPWDQWTLESAQQFEVWRRDKMNEKLTD